MSGDEITRLERKLDEVLGELRENAEHLAAIRQWKDDKAHQCERHERAIADVKQAIGAETLQRAEAVAGVQLSIGKHVTAQAAIAAGLGAVIPGLVLLIKLLPLLKAAGG